MRNPFTRFQTPLSGLLAFSALGSTWAQDLTPDQIEFFESKIRPVLVEYCYECHSQDEKIKGGLSLDSREALLHGGDSGEALVPGDPEASLLYTAISWADEDYEMPPRRKLSADIIADFEKWVRMGAPDPRVTETVVVKTEIDIEAGKEFWSFKKPVKADAPEVQDADWPRDEVDSFVLAALEEMGLKPVGDAKPEVLLRRLTFDLIGLPPRPEEVKAFITAWQSDPQGAIEAKVDELLAMEQFGERWGRHWLDVARYAESTGKEVNQTFPHAWRYRDYVIDSFNADKPYDRFVKEQIAGDLLPINNDEEWQENLIATGFLALGTKSLNERDPRQFRMDLIDEQIDTTTQAILGLTVACARCHDHKSDPIPTSDYYAMAGMFLSTETYFGGVNALQSRRASDLLLLPVADAHSVSQSYSEEEIARMKQRIEDAETQLAEARRAQFMQRRNPDSTMTAEIDTQTFIRLNATISQTQARLNTVDESGNPKTFGMGVQDLDAPLEATVLVRGEIDKPAQKVSRGLPQVLHHAETPDIPADGSGRLELAEWMVSEENPLTARVLVNRVWQTLFGQGLVTTPDNFGMTGQAPSHPELLDHLAVRFMEEGWSFKSLVRELVLTRTYQLSSDFESANYSQDPENTYLWRATPRRLDAEALRDAILATSGDLKLDRPHASIVAELGDTQIGRRVNADTINQPVKYRSVYLPVVRDAMPEALDLFDGADPNIVTGARENTNVPSQALYMMNNPFVTQQAEAMARRLIQEAETPKQRFSRAFVLAYGRLATEEEIASSMAFFQEFMPMAMEQSRGRDQAGFLTLSTFCQGLMASAEFRYLN